jgi:hypothetical protein
MTKNDSSKKSRHIGTCMTRYKTYASRWVPQVRWRWRWRKVPHVHVTRKPLDPTGRMEKGPIGTRQMEKGPSGDFYDELQASQMSNSRSHRYTSDGEGSHRYTSDGERIEQRLYDKL